MDSQLKFLKLGTPKPKGIQTPMVYAGAPGSHFNPHVEENLLYSINYVFDVSTSLNSLFSNRFTIQDFFQIEGTHPKHWYALRPEHQCQFEEYIKERWPQLFSKCSNYLGHRSVMFHPELILKEMGLPLAYGVQYPGMYAITMGGGYHFGYNEGLNLAEVINKMN